MNQLSSSPFSHRPLKTPELMRLVILCCIPGIVVQAYFFGWGNLVQILIASVTAMAAEALVMICRRRPVFRSLRDNSALLTGVLLGIALPPYLPFWMTMIACFFAIAAIKQLYGGLGQNPFNPAMAGYVLLLIAFPVAMTSWLPITSQAQYQPDLWQTIQLIFTGFTSDGYSAQQMRAMVDGHTAATALDLVKTELRAGLASADILQHQTIGLVAGKGWEWVNAAFLLGGLYLVKRKLIPLSIPAGFLATLFVCATLGYLLSPEHSPSPLFHLFSGATMLGAFFIATDPVSASTTARGRWLYAALIGFLVYCIRSWGGYPDAVAFSVLLANMSVSLIDYYTQPKTYGHKPTAKNQEEQ